VRRAEQRLAKVALRLVEALQGGGAVAGSAGQQQPSQLAVHLAEADVRSVEAALVTQLQRVRVLDQRVGEVSARGTGLPDTLGEHAQRLAPVEEVLRIHRGVVQDGHGDLLDGQTQQSDALRLGDVVPLHLHQHADAFAQLDQTHVAHTRSHAQHVRLDQLEHAHLLAALVGRVLMLMLMRALLLMVMATR